MTDETVETTENDRSNLLRQAYGAATARVREAHRDEFEAAYAEEAKARGVDYTPRPTAEQKAEAQIRELLEAHPGLRERIAPAGVGSGSTTPLSAPQDAAPEA